MLCLTLSTVLVMPYLVDRLIAPRLAVISPLGTGQPGSVPGARFEDFGAEELRIAPTAAAYGDSRHSSACALPRYSA